MIKITMTVKRYDAIEAMTTAFQYAKDYMPTRKPNIPMLLHNKTSHNPNGKSYWVHHTKNNSVVIKYK